MSLNLITEYLNVSEYKFLESRVFVYSYLVHELKQVWFNERWLVDVGHLYTRVLQWLDSASDNEKTSFPICMAEIRTRFELVFMWGENRPMVRCFKTDKPRLSGAIELLKCCSFYASKREIKVTCRNPRYHISRLVSWLPFPTKNGILRQIILEWSTTRLINSCQDDCIAIVE